MRRVSLSAIAREAGVSRPIVSAILGGARSTAGYSQATFEQVMQAARDLGYFAGSVSSDVTTCVGLMASCFVDLQHGLLDCIADDARRRGWHLRMIRSDDLAPPPEVWYQGLHGLVMLGSVDWVAQAEACARRGLPVAALNAPPDLLSRVGFDDANGTVELAAWLHDRGCRRIVYHGETGGNYARDRIQALVQAQRAGMFELVATCGLLSPKDLATWLQQHPVDGVIFHNGLVVPRMRYNLAQAGFMYGHDLQVAAYHLPHNYHIDHPAAFLECPVEGLARVLLDLAVMPLTGRIGMQVMMPYTLRATTA